MSIDEEVVDVVVAMASETEPTQDNGSQGMYMVKVPYKILDIVFCHLT